MLTQIAQVRSVTPLAALSHKFNCACSATDLSNSGSACPLRRVRLTNCVILHFGWLVSLAGGPLGVSLQSILIMMWIGSPEAAKAWSKNMGHDNMNTTYTSYGDGSPQRQAEIILG